MAPDLQAAPRILRFTPLFSTIEAIFKGQNAYLVENGLEIHVVASPSDRADAFAREEGFTFHPAKMLRRASALADLKAIIQAVALTRSLQPDLVHTHTSKGGMIGMVASYLCRVPIRVHSVAGWSLPFHKGPGKLVLSLAEKTTLGLATHILVNSRGLRDELVATGYVAATDPRIRILGRGSSNGVDLLYFDAERWKDDRRRVRESFRVGPSDILLAFVGRIMLEKGISDLIQAFCSLSESRYHLLLIGEFEVSSRKPLPSALVHTIRSHPRIHVSGWVREVPPFLSAADVLVHPSLAEGLPNCILQASAMGVPSIGANVRGTRDLVTDGSTGLLVPAGSVSALKESIETLGRDESLRRRLGVQAKQFVAQNFDRRQVCRNLLDFYRSVCHEMAPTGTNPARGSR